MSASSTASPPARWNGSISAAATGATSNRPMARSAAPPARARYSSAGRCARGWITCLVTPEQFLFHEARLLDTQRYEEWLQLFTEDATYWVPPEQGQKDPYQTSPTTHPTPPFPNLPANHPRTP